MADDITKQVKDLIADQLGHEESEIELDASFTNDLGADSLDTVELIMEFEKKFELTIPDEDAEKILKVEDAIAYIKEKKGLAE